MARLKERRRDCVIVVVAVTRRVAVGRCLVCCAVVVDVCGIMSNMLVLLLPVLLLMLAAATGCYSWTYYHYRYPGRLGIIALALVIGIRHEVHGPGDGGAVCRHGRAGSLVAVATTTSRLLRRSGSLRAALRAIHLAALCDQLVIRVGALHFVRDVRRRDVFSQRALNSLIEVPAA